MIRNWGTFSVDEFASHFVGAPDHPDHDEFLEILIRPDVQPPFVEYSNMRNYWEQAQRAAAGQPSR